MQNNKYDDGGPAYARAGFNLSGDSVDEEGMTLLDKFASTVDVPWDAAHHTLKSELKRVPTGMEIAEFRANYKYVEAAAMIAEKRKKEVQE